MPHNDVADIREAAPDEHWAQFARSWTALLTYRYLGKGSPFIDKGVERETMVLRHDMRNTTGGIMAAPLCIAAPEPWWLDDACVPAPVTMTYAIVDPAHDVTRIEVLREVVSIGRQMGFSRSRVVDAADHDRVIAISSGSGVSLGTVPGGYQPVDNPLYELEDSPGLPALRDVFGVHAGPDGRLRIDAVTPALASPHAALHLGPVNIALEAAAIDELQRTTGSADQQVEQWSVMMVKPGYTGPFVATARVVNPGGTLLAVETTMTDEGAGGRTIATATAAFRPVRTT